MATNLDSAESLAILLKLIGNGTHTAFDGVEALERAAAAAKPGEAGSTTPLSSRSTTLLLQNYWQRRPLASKMLRLPANGKRVQQDEMRKSNSSGKVGSTGFLLFPGRSRQSITPETGHLLSTVRHHRGRLTLSFRGGAAARRSQ
jgi:hypothetical protein